MNQDIKLPALKEIIDERKEKAIENLSASYAKNRLPLEEYERLVEYISKIESERELIVVEKIVVAHSEDGAESTSGKNGNGDDDTEDEENEGRKRRRTLSKSSAVNLNVLSSRTFSGPLKSGANFVSVLGDGRIRIRKADLKKPTTVLNVVSVLGDFVVAVESGIRVINNAIPVLSDSTINNKVTKEAEDDAPELIITGIALLSDINVKLLKD
jgi:hypothetical protein